MKLKGKRALVTGGSRGIGEAIAKALAKEGADVAITYERSAERAAAVVKELEGVGRRGVALQADSAAAEAVRRSVKETAKALGGVDILVNNAGIYRGGPIEELKLEDLDAMLQVNVRSVIVASQAALEHLGQGGRIVNIGSCLAERVAWPGSAVYAMTKSALNAWTRGLARDLGPRGVTVNTVHPGPTVTEMTSAEGEFAEKMRGHMALGRFGSAEEVAAAVLFLAGPDAGQITGTGLVIDGGLNA